MNEQRSFVRLAFGFALLGVLAGGAAAQGDTVRITGVYGINMTPGVAVLPVRAEYGDSIRAILQRDLENGDRVTIVGHDPSGLPIVAEDMPFELFGRVGVNQIVQATAMMGSLHVAVLDVGTKTTRQVEDFLLRGPPLSPEWRMSLHMAADEIERWITGVRGISATRIAFVRGGQIWTVDSDGEHAVAVPGTENGLSPAWHPTGDYLAFHTLTESGTQVAIRDLVGNTTRRLTATRSGSNFTPVFSPDGTTLAYASGEAGTDIVAVDWMHPTHRRTIASGSTNSSPTFSPDGRRIAFTSGRLGQPQIYISDVDGSNVDLLTVAGLGDQSYRSNPSWSSDGRTIAYQSQIDGRFQIMTISLGTRSVVARTSEGENEDPDWAPDGRHLVFTSNRSGVRQLWVLDTESGRTRQLTRGSGSVRNGAWSPNLTRR
jgi:TolB protein